MSIEYEGNRNIPANDLNQDRSNITPSHIQLGDLGESLNFKLEGLEASHPAVQKFREALQSGATIQLIDGGSMGKTEITHTALDLEGRSFAKFDLRAWTLNKLGDAEWRKSFKADIAGDLQSTDLYDAITALEERFADPTRETLKHYYYSDPDYLIKRTENLMLKYFQEEIRRELTAAGIDVVILDEFDLTCGKDFVPYEINSVDILTGILADLPAQVVLISHPHAESSPRFREIISERFPAATRLNTEHIPSKIAYKALALGGINSGDADRYLAHCKGLPLAYVPLMSDKSGIRASGLSLEALEEKTQAKIAKVADLILRGLDPEIVDLIYDFARGSTPENINPDQERALQDTTFVYRNNAGELAMAPIVREVLLARITQ